MEVIILAGGYATRLRPLSEYIPKPLFPIGGVPLLNYIIQKVWEIKPKRIIISTNSRFENHFRYWIKTLEIMESSIVEKIELVIEPTRYEDEKFGALAGLQYAIKEAWVQDDLLVVAGDNLFDFDLKKIKRRVKEYGYITVALYDIGNIEKARRFGVAVVDPDYKIIEFQEKPEKPKSTLISTGIYGFPYEKITLLDEYLNSNGHRDALGKFFEWLIRKDNVYGYPYKGLWFDIGTFDSYVEANRYVEQSGWNRRWLWP